MADAVTARQPVTGEAAPGADRRSPSWSVPGVLIAGFLVQFAVRLVPTFWRTGPIAVADEIGYLIHARVLAGGPSADLSKATFYRGGVSLFFVPAQWFADDPDTVYALTLGTCALLGALTFPILSALLDLVLPDVPRATRTLAAFLGALMPAVVSYAQLATAEALLAPLLAGWLYLLALALRQQSTGGSPWAANLGMGVLGGLAWAAHSRSLVLLVVGVLVMAVQVLAHAVRRDRMALPWAAGIVATIVGCLLAGRLNTWLQERNYPLGGDSVTSGLTDKIKSFRALVHLLGRTTGQLWSTFAGSFGLVAVGGLAALACLVSGRWASGWNAGVSARRFIDDPLRMVSATALVVFLGSAAGSALVLMGVLPNAHYYFYERYIDYIAPLFLALGVVALLTRPARQVLALGAGAVVLIVAAVAVPYVDAPKAVSAPNGNPVVVPGIAILSLTRVTTSNQVALHPRLATVTGCVALVVLVTLVLALRSQVWRWLGLGAVTCAGFAVSIVWIFTQVIVATDRNFYPNHGDGSDLAIVRQARHLAWADVGADAFWKFDYLFLSGRPMTVFALKSPPPADADVVLAFPSWPGAQYGFRLVRMLPDDPFRAVWTR